MVVASGFVEVKGTGTIKKIVGELKKRNMQIDYIETKKVIFLFERKSFNDVRTEIDSLRNIEDIRNVHLTYYSYEGDRKGAESDSDRRGEPQDPMTDEKIP